MEVLLISPWGGLGGIAEYSRNLKAAIEAADPTITIRPLPEACRPTAYWEAGLPDAIILNWQGNVTGEWAARHVGQLRQTLKVPVVVIAHDTFGEHTPAWMQEQGDTRLDELDAMTTVADAVIVHEPCAGLEERTIYWRQGVPESSYVGYQSREVDTHPILGTAGFDFPWKNYTRLAEVTGRLGWGFCLCTPEALTTARRNEITAQNPLTTFHPALDQGMLIGTLRACDATAFCYGASAYAGTSAAIRLGIAAKKPILALRNRQFRDLMEDDRYRTIPTIGWCESWEGVGYALRTCPMVRLDPKVCALAERDSWAGLGVKWVELLRRLA